MSRAALVLALLCLLAPGMARAQALDVAVAPVAGAPEPFDTRIAGAVAEALAAAGLEASAQPNAAATYQLAGRAEATPQAGGTRLALAWTLRSADGTTAEALAAEAMVPYTAADPWDAIDADSLARLGAETARIVEAAIGAASGGVPIRGARQGDAAQAPRPAGPATRVFLRGVTGAPGDGNQALPQALAEILIAFDVVFVAAPSADAFVIAGQVVLVKEKPAEDRVGILWTIEDHAGRELARVEQDNAVPAGSLAVRWGEAALYAAEGAADGLLTALAELGTPGAAR